VLRSGGSLDGVALNITDLVTFVTLTLVTSGGWNGDIYAYVEHNGAITVLLNRAGLTSENPAGAATTGMNVTFSDAAATDVHSGLSTTYGTLATGIYQPDGRAADPDEVLDSSPRTLSFSGFTGQVASGDWTLFIADVAGHLKGDVTLQAYIEVNKHRGDHGILASCPQSLMKSRFCGVDGEFVWIPCGTERASPADSEFELQSSTDMERSASLHSNPKWEVETANDRAWTRIFKEFHLSTASPC
jgi:hypothetical protein